MMPVTKSLTPSIYQSTMQVTPIALLGEHQQSSSLSTAYHLPISQDSGVVSTSDTQEYSDISVLGGAAELVHKVQPHQQKIR
jgi:hypothetical protein